MTRSAKSVLTAFPNYQVRLIITPDGLNLSPSSRSAMLGVLVDKSAR